MILESGRGAVAREAWEGVEGAFDLLESEIVFVSPMGHHARVRLSH